MGGLTDLPHAALTNDGSHVVMPELGADLECHELLLTLSMQITRIVS